MSTIDQWREVYRALAKQCREVALEMHAAGELPLPPGHRAEALNAVKLADGPHPEGQLEIRVLPVSCLPTEGDEPCPS